MADTEGFNSRDWDQVAHWIRGEWANRKGRRAELEALWKEIDRQVAMTPQARQIASGTEKDWFPNTELPLQFNALEVVAADARQLLFPRGTQWYKPTAEITGAYEDRFRINRETRPLVGEEPAPEAEDEELDAFVLEQETADILVKATIDHFHRLYDFRGAIDLFLAEQIKYGTGVVRVRPVTYTKFSHEFRGVKSDNMEGPAVIPCSIKDVYLDDTPSAMMHEGQTVSPSVIRQTFQRLSDLIRAAKTGGKERGWILKNLKKLEAKDDQIVLLEFEGDLTVPRSRGSIFLPNSLITVAVTSDQAQPVRFRQNPTPYRSYVQDYYMRDQVTSAYGASPLMKGQPIQEAATLAFNSLMAAAALNADPPLAYDRNDFNLAATGGPNVHPGAQFAADSPNAIEVIEVGNVGALLQVYTGLLQQYEDLTGVNDPRRGAPARSHTTATQGEIEQARGIARTGDFVNGNEKNSLPTILNMEYDIIKRTMRRTQPVYVRGNGMDGWVRLNASDLADNVLFMVEGSAGVVSERERLDRFVAATNFAMQTVNAAAALGQPVGLDWLRLIEEGYQRAGVDNASQFISGSGQSVSQPAVGPELSPLAGANGQAEGAQVPAAQ